MESVTEQFSNLAIDAPNLQKNLKLLSPDQVSLLRVLFYYYKLHIDTVDFALQVKLAQMLVEMGQTHLFQHWPDAGVDDDLKRSFFEQVINSFRYLELCYIVMS